MRHIPKCRMYPRGLPHLWHLLMACTWYLGVRFHFAILDFLAKLNPPQFWRVKGTPIISSSRSAWRSSLVLVVIVT